MPYSIHGDTQEIPGRAEPHCPDIDMSGESLVPLPQGAGYGVVVGVGLAFGIGMVGVNKFLEKFLLEKSDHTEM